MESFFLAETTKYLYLLFDEDNFIHNSNGQRHRSGSDAASQCLIGDLGYIFNTEAHPLDVGAVNCCRTYNRATGEFIKPRGKAPVSFGNDANTEHLTGKYKCKARPFYQRMFQDGSFLEDHQDMFW